MAVFAVSQGSVIAVNTHRCLAHTISDVTLHEGKKEDDWVWKKLARGNNLKQDVGHKIHSPEKTGTNVQCMSKHNTDVFKVFF